MARSTYVVYECPACIASGKPPAQARIMRARTSPKPHCFEHMGTAMRVVGNGEAEDEKEEERGDPER